MAAYFRSLPSKNKSPLSSVRHDDASGRSASRPYMTSGSTLPVDLYCAYTHDQRIVMGDIRIQHAALRGLLLSAAALFAADPIEAVFEKAVAALAAQDYVAAERGFVTVLKTKPDNVGALGNLGVVYTRLPDFRGRQRCRAWFLGPSRSPARRPRNPERRARRQLFQTRPQWDRRRTERQPRVEARAAQHVECGYLPLRFSGREYKRNTGRPARLIRTSCRVVRQIALRHRHDAPRTAGFCFWRVTNENKPPKKALPPR